MNVADLLLSQLLDPFRIGLLLALIFTARNTAATMGMAVPVALGVVFVAVLIPLTTQSDAPKAAAIGVGLIANAVLVGIMLAAWAAWRRLSATRSD